MELKLREEFKFKIKRYFGVDEFTKQLLETMVTGLRASPKWISENQIEQLRGLGFSLIIEK